MTLGGTAQLEQTDSGPTVCS